MENIEFAEKFPFTDQAKQIIDSVGLELNETIVISGIERIKQAIAGKTKKKSGLHTSEKIQNIASYAAARVILGYMRNSYLTNKFAVAESKTIASEVNKKEDIEQLEDFFKIKKKQFDDGTYIVLPSFLKFAPKSVDYKIINRTIKKGNVLVSQREEIRIIEEAIRKYLEKIPRVTNPPETIKKAQEEIKEMLPRIEPQKISMKEGDNPPCIEKILQRLFKHENLSHQERFVLGTYLVNRKMEMEKIVQLYQNLPDYDERITKYQLEHIVKRGYTTPACATVLSYGLCCADCRIGNPLNWRAKISENNG